MQYTLWLKSETAVNILAYLASIGQWLWEVLSYSKPVETYICFQLVEGMCLLFRSLLVFLFYLNNNICHFFSFFQLFVSSQSPHSTTDDMYLEGQTSGDLPIDDEDREIDGSGGSGSGDYSKETPVFVL